MVMIRSVKGMHDVLPDESDQLRRVENTAVATLFNAGYRQIRLPLLERADLFSRSLGEATDVVEKEMYTFEDRGGDRLSLRPEGTAGCVRAGLEHGLLRAGCHCRWWYSGAFFRRERPQKGRYRQFRQVGAEAFGFAGADIDVELLALTALIWERLGVDKQLTLKLNSLGNEAVRRRHRDDLVDYLLRNADRLDERARGRIHANPLRLLDSKDECIREVVSGAPRLSAYLDAQSGRHFEEVQKRLEGMGIEFELDEHLVRGLDYYTHTVFEWVADAGAQSAVCAGGRYDGLVQALGGVDVAAAGFAIGVERLAALAAPAAPEGAHVYMVVVGEQAERMAQKLSVELRRALPQLRIVFNCGGGSFKAQMKRADKSGAVLALLIGDDEVANGQVTIKFLRSEQEQRKLPAGQVAGELDRILPVLQSSVY